MFDAWITAERRRFRGIQTVLLENLARALPHEAAAPYLDEWLQALAFRSQCARTAARRRWRGTDASPMVRRTSPAACKLFEADGLDSAPLHDLWRSTREKHAAHGAARRRARTHQRQPHRDSSLGARRVRGHASRVHRRHAIRRPLVRSRQARRRGRRAGLRRHHAAGQAPQHVRDRAGHHVRTARSRHRTRRSRAHAQRGLRGQRLGAAQWPEIHRERGSHRNAHRAHRLGRGVRREDRRRARRARRDRQPHRRLDRARDRNGGAQSRDPEAAELARRLGSASPRPVAHVPLQQDGQRAGAAVLRAGRGARSHVRARLCRPVVRAFPERLPGLEEACARDRSRLRSRGQEPDGRRPRPGRALGHGPRNVAARRTGPGRQRTGTRRGPLARTTPPRTTRSPSCMRSPAIRTPRYRSRIIRASCRRSTRCCSRCSARAPSASRGSGNTRTPPSGPSRRRRAPTRTSTSWPSPRFSLGLAGRIEEANEYKTRIRERVPDYAMADFLAAFRYSPDAEALFKQAGKKVGIV